MHRSIRQFQQNRNIICWALALSMKKKKSLPVHHQTESERERERECVFTFLHVDSWVNWNKQCITENNINAHDSTQQKPVNKLPTQDQWSLQITCSSSFDLLAYLFSLPAVLYKVVLYDRKQGQQYTRLGTAINTGSQTTIKYLATVQWNQLGLLSTQPIIWSTIPQLQWQGKVRTDSSDMGKWTKNSICMI